MKEKQDNLKVLAKAAREAVQLFESGTLEQLYQEAVEQAEAISDETIRNSKLAILYWLKEDNEKKYKKSKTFLELYNNIYPQN